MHGSTFRAGSPPFLMNILIVEDDAVTSELLVKILGGYGECHCATTGEDAYTKFLLAHGAFDPFDLITLDQSLPGMNGHETALRIRKWEETYRCANVAKTSTMIMVTSNNQPSEILASFRNGCEGYLVKPVTPDNVKLTLQKLGFHVVREPAAS